MGAFKNALFCEDVREETGNKKSLMGVFSGDILVAEFPATIKMAAYFEYVSDQDEDTVSVELRMLQDDQEIAKGQMRGEIKKGANRSINFVLPQGYLGFEKPGTFRLLISANGGPEQEIINKKILLLRPS